MPTPERGMCPGALIEAEKGHAPSEGGLRGKALRGVVNAMLRLQLEAQKALDKLKPASGPPHFVKTYQCASIHVMLGHQSEAFAWLDKAV